VTLSLTPSVSDCLEHAPCGHANFPSPKRTQGFPVTGLRLIFSVPGKVLLSSAGRAGPEAAGRSVARWSRAGMGSAVLSALAPARGRQQSADGHTQH